jgi:hypothetical protein
MKSLRIAGRSLQINGGVTLIFGLLISGVYIYSEGLSFNVNALLLLIIFLVWCYTLLMVGKGVFTGNKKYKTPGLIVAIISLFTSPVGLVCGFISLFFQIKGRESFINA